MTKEARQQSPGLCRSLQGFWRYVLNHNGNRMSPLLPARHSHRYRGVWIEIWCLLMVPNRLVECCHWHCSRLQVIFSQVSAIVSSLTKFKVTKPTTHSEWHPNVMKVWFEVTYPSVTISNCVGSSVSLMSSLATFQIGGKFKQYLSLTLGRVASLVGTGFTSHSLVGTTTLVCFEHSCGARRVTGVSPSLL